MFDVRFFKSSLGKHITLVLKINVFALLISIFSINAIYGLEFSIDSYKDVSGSRSVISKDGIFFIRKGSRNISLCNWGNPHTMLGMVEWKDNMTSFSSEYFLYSENEDPLVLLYKSLEKKQNIYSKIEVYNFLGKKLGKIELDCVLDEKCLSVSPNKKCFGIYNNSSIDIYRAGSQLEKKYSFNTQVKNPDIFQISNSGSIFVLGDSKSIYYGDMYKPFCKIIGTRDELSSKYKISLSAFEISPTKFVIISQNGNGWLIEGTLISKFSITHNAQIIEIYAKNMFFYVVTSKSVNVYSIVDKKLQGQFDLDRYYKTQFGDNLNEKAFITDSEFDSRNNTFYLKGSTSIKTMFKVRVLF